MSLEASIPFAWFTRDDIVATRSCREDVGELELEMDEAARWDEAVEQRVRQGVCACDECVQRDLDQEDDY